MVREAGTGELRPGLTAGWDQRRPPLLGPVLALALPLARWGVVVAHLSEGPTSSASTSTALRRSPSGVSQERVLSRPRTRARSPLDSESVTCSARSRQALIRKEEV